MNQKRPRGRPRQFDETEVLDAALAAFWRSGYGATSLDDLGRATGLNKPSIYASFGNKEVLFERVLDRYMATYGQTYLDALNATGDLACDLKTHFDVFIDVVTGKTGPGCPLACTLPAETENSARIRDKLREFLGTADRETAANDFGERRQIRCDAEFALRAAMTEAKADHLIEDQQNIVVAGEAA